LAPIAELTTDHEEILQMAWEVAEASSSEPGSVSDEFDALFRLLTSHARKEEAGLYPQLVSRGDLDGARLAHFEAEHRELHEALLSGSFDRDTYYLLAAHIEAEENELFPSAMYAFDDEGWSAIEKAHRMIAEG